MEENQLLNGQKMRNRQKNKKFNNNFEINNKYIKLFSCLCSY